MSRPSIGPRTLTGIACLLAAAAVLHSVPLAAEDDMDLGFLNHNQITLRGPDGSLVRGYRCASPEPGPDEMAAVIQALAHEDGERRRGRRIVVPVAFHVLYTVDEDGRVIGIPEYDQIEAQIAVLNEAYEGFLFYLASVDSFQQTEREPWFDQCFQQHVRMKRALAISPATTLNLYSCVPSYGPYLLLGFSYLPQAFPEDDERHGVVLLYSSLPGGGAVPYDEGDTATHEVGHYLGLFHTFQDGCDEPGDMIDDTPFEATAAFGCPEGRDTCPQPGEDPIHNFMDYTDDPCMDHFTPHQDERMDLMVELYKPTLLTNRPPR